MGMAVCHRSVAELGIDLRRAGLHVDLSPMSIRRETWPLTICHAALKAAGVNA